MQVSLYFHHTRARPRARVRTPVFVSVSIVRTRGDLIPTDLRAIWSGRAACARKRRRFFFPSRFAVVVAIKRSDRAKPAFLHPPADLWEAPSCWRLRKFAQKLAPAAEARA